MSRRDTATIRALFDFRELYAELVPSGVLRGKRATCPDPAHTDRHPSASIDERGWHCHACGVGGDAIALVQLTQGCDFAAACDWLESRAGTTARIDATRHPIGPVERQVQRYLQPPSPERRRAMAALWDVLCNRNYTRFSDDAARWLERRGLSTATAARMGCRDWTQHAAEIIDLVRSWDRDTKLASGLFHARGAWMPLSLMRDGRAQGVAMPCWHPSVPHPIAWRWRWCAPVWMGDRSVKTHASLGGVWPVGSQSPDPFTPSPAHADLVVIAEGEPDWLSFAHVIERNERLRSYVAVVGVCDVGSGWRVDLAPSKGRYLLAIHDNAATEAFVAGAKRDVGERRVLVATLPEGEDANDLLRAGKLAQWLEAKCP